jgi:hypothetical protein
MATHRPPIGDALEGVHSSHLHPSGCRGLFTGHRSETQAERPG